MIFHCNSGVKMLSDNDQCKHGIKIININLYERKMGSMKIIAPEQVQLFFFDIKMPSSLIQMHSICLN